MNSKVLNMPARDGDTATHSHRHPEFRTYASQRADALNERYLNVIFVTQRLSHLISRERPHEDEATTVQVGE